MILTKDEVTSLGLNIAYDVISRSSEFKNHCTVVGAFALYKELNSWFELSKKKFQELLKISIWTIMLITLMI